MLIEKECLVCNKIVKIPHWREAKFKFCSKACSAEFKKAGTNCKCAQCGIDFHMKPSMKKQRKNTFCSVSCFASWKSINLKGTNNPNFRNKMYDCDGYRMVHSVTSGRKKEHIIVALESLGIDKIPKGYHVHHRDCNHLNNVPENLVVLSISDHKWLHAQFGNAGLFAYYYKKITKEELSSWSNNQELTNKLLDLNVLNQSVSL